MAVASALGYSARQRAFASVYGEWYRKGVLLVDITQNKHSCTNREDSVSYNQYLSKKLR